MEMWKSDIGGEFTESRNNGEGYEKALSFSITYKGCYNCKIAQTFYFIRFRVIGEVFFFFFILIGILCC